MQRRCALLLVLLGLASGAPLHAAPLAARTVIQDCAAHADPDEHGIEALGAACPGLAAAIQELRLDALLPADWKRRISAATLSDLDALADRYGQRALPAPLDPSRLQTIARLLPAPARPPQFAWVLFWRWVMGWLALHWPAWLRPHWTAGAGLVGALAYVLVALLLATAVAIVIIELRAAGLLGGRPQRASTGRLVPRQLETTESGLGPLDIEAAAPRLRPVLLLRWLVAALTRSQRLTHEQDLTCRELVTAARFDTSAQRELFTRIALHAEQALYGDAGHGGPPLKEALLGDARDLHRELLAAPLASPSS
jgi:hypothetical protein